MTVQEWIAARTPPPPVALQEGVRTALGDDASAPVELTAEACLRAAVRELRAILDARRFDRPGALDLLVVDALTTYAYEYAGGAGGADLVRVAEEGLRRLGTLAASNG